jgi:hypothetical protein
MTRPARTFVAHPRHPLTGKQFTLRARTKRELEAYLAHLDKLREGLRLGTLLTCACLGFKLATPNKPNNIEAQRLWRDAGDRFIAERAARLRGAADLRTNAERARTAADGKHTKGDSLLLLRIATALERVAESLERAHPTESDDDAKDGEADR